MRLENRLLASGTMDNPRNGNRLVPNIIGGCFTQKANRNTGGLMMNFDRRPISKELSMPISGYGSHDDNIGSIGNKHPNFHNRTLRTANFSKIQKNNNLLPYYQGMPQTSKFETLRSQNTSQMNPTRDARPVNSSMDGNPKLGLSKLNFNPHQEGDGQFDKRLELLKKLMRRDNGGRVESNIAVDRHQKYLREKANNQTGVLGTKNKINFQSSHHGVGDPFDRRIDRPERGWIQIKEEIIMVKDQDDYSNPHDVGNCSIDISKDNKKTGFAVDPKIRTSKDWRLKTSDLRSSILKQDVKQMSEKELLQKHSKEAVKMWENLVNKSWNESVELESNIKESNPHEITDDEPPKRLLNCFEQDLSPIRSITSHKIKASCKIWIRLTH